MKWSDTIATLHDLFSQMQVTDKDDRQLSADHGFQLWLDYAADLRVRDQFLFLVGNGASSSMASHFATDIMKNGRIKTMIFTDASLLSAVGNDYCFDQLYKKPLQWYSSTGDLLIAISSSGRSENVLQSCNYAQQTGLKVVTLSAMRPDNPLRKKGHLNFYVTAKSYGTAESSHAVILHHWMDMLEQY